MNEVKLAERDAKLDKEKTQRYALYMGLLLTLIFAVFMFNQFKLTQNQKKFIENQKSVLEKSQRKILESIDYAKKIQNSILPQSKVISKFLPQHFVFFKPKDVVSGDFYWFHHYKKKSFLAVADCTGHGVPGAFMTMIANSILREIIIGEKLISPDLILYKLHHLLHKTLQQKKGDDYAQDGLDISLCVVDHDENLIHFSGARNHGYLTDGKDIRILKATQNSIGGLSQLGEMEPYRLFTSETVQLQKNTLLVLTTDGFLDQLNKHDEKYGIRRLKNMIIAMHAKEFESSLDFVRCQFVNWKEGVSQLDDVLLCGIRF